MPYLDRESKNKQKSLRDFVCNPQGFCMKTQKCSKWSSKFWVPVKNRVPTKVRVFWGKIPFYTYFFNFFYRLRMCWIQKINYFSCYPQKSGKKLLKMCYISPGPLYNATFWFLQCLCPRWYTKFFRNHQWKNRYYNII